MHPQQCFTSAAMPPAPLESVGQAPSAGPAKGQDAMTEDWWHAVHSVNMEQHVKHLDRFQWRYDQLSAGAFHARLAELAMPRVRVFRETITNSTQQSGLPPDGSIGLGLPLAPDAPMWMNGMRVAGGRVIMSHGAEIELCTAPDCEMGFVIADAAVIEETMQRTGVHMARHLRRKAAVVQLSSTSEDALRQILALVHGNFGVPPEALRSGAARRQLEDHLILELVDALSSASALPEERNALLRKRVVDRARELMLSALEAPLSILDVCSRIGASRRKLNYCFQEVLGTTPVAYLRAIRLNGVRRELLDAAQAGGGVYDIAVRWGFWHFSQFSMDYKRQFGELPSRTLQRARGACGLA